MQGMKIHLETTITVDICTHFIVLVKSTISDLGYSDISEWYIGHSGSTYYRKSEKEKAELFRKVKDKSFN